MHVLTPNIERQKTERRKKNALMDLRFTNEPQTSISPRSVSL